MDACEATKVVMSRIRSLDPVNASRIIGYILIQEQGEQEIIRLAFSSDSVLLSRINQARACLGLPITTLSNPIRPNDPFPRTSPQHVIPNNGFHLNNPSSPFPISSPKPISYAAVLNGSSSGSNSSGNIGLGSSSLNFCGGNDFGVESSFADNSMVGQNPIKSPSGRDDSLVFPYGEDVNGGSVWKSCVYFARGFCKNGNSCKFLHSDIGVGETVELESPNTNNSGRDEFLRMKAQQQQQRLGFMASGDHDPFSYNKNMNFLNENQRHELSIMGHGAVASSKERQIYLTFPAESTFKEEDVANYFSKFGPVQDVRIPYHQPRRMFGFVTFVRPETVKLILAKGNPHYVCDCRVLVKPYMDKAQLLDKKQMQHQHQHQHVEGGDYSSRLSPSGVVPRELFDLPTGSPLVPTGSRMLVNTQEMMLRRKLELEAELRRAIELRSQRMMNLQLMDLNNQHHNHCFLPNLPVGVPFSSPKQSQLLMSRNGISDSTIQDALRADDVDGTESTDNRIVSGNGQHVNDDDSNFCESLEHMLPKYLFATPTRSATENQSVFSNASAKADNSVPVTNISSNNTPVVPSSSPLGKTNS